MRVGSSITCCGRSARATSTTWSGGPPPSWACRTISTGGSTMPRGGWMFDPDSGGVKITDPVKRRTEARIRQVAEAEFAGRYTRLDIRFRGQFCYIDAYTEPEPPAADWPPPDWPETREQYLERLRNTPTHLCRLRYFGADD